MTKNQENHACNIISAFNIIALQKYKRGARRHGGNLLKKDTLELLLEIRDEAIDTFIYTQTAIENEIDKRRE